MNTPEPDDAAVVESWSTPVIWLLFMPAILGVLTIGGVSILVQTLSGNAGPSLFFLVFWFAALGWNIYWWLFRIAYRVELVGDTLYWWAPLSRGEVPVAAVESVGRSFGARSTCVLRATGHRSVTVFTQVRSFTPMLRALNRMNASIPAEQR